MSPEQIRYLQERSQLLTNMVGWLMDNINDGVRVSAEAKKDLIKILDDVRVTTEERPEGV